MGVVQQMKTEAARTLNKRPPKPSVAVSVNVATANTDAMLARFPIELRRKVLKQAVRAAAGEVRKAARSKLSPKRSIKTGTRELWSASEQAERGDWPENLWKSIKVRVKDYDTAVVAMVGPSRPYGNHGHLIEYGSNLAAWGRDTDQRIPPFPFMRPAADTTKRKQQTVILRKMRREWTKV